MKLEIETKVLQEALKTVAVAIDGGISLPILQGVKLVAEGKLLTLCATNLELYCTVRAPAKVAKAGAVVVSHDMLSRLASHLDASTIQFNASEKLLSVSSGQTEADLDVITAAEFPPEIEQDEKLGKTIEPSHITIPFTKVAHSMATDTSRSLLMGINIRPNGTGVDFAATSGTRISVYRGEAITKQDVIVADGYVRALLKIPMKDDEVVLNIDNGMISIEGKSVKLSGKLVEGNFPNWKQVIPTDIKKVFSCGRKELISALRTCAIFTQREMPGLTLKGKKKEIEVTKPNKAKVMVLGTELAGQPDFSVGVNSRQILESLEILEEDNVRMQFVDDRTAFLIEEGPLREVLQPVVKA